MEIRKAGTEQGGTAAELALLLWPGHTLSELEAEFQEIICSPEGAVFLAWEGESAAAFAQCQLRHDYVEGTDSSPVGYLEGVYVRPEYQKRGVARALLRACEEWAREMGCKEFASDCEIHNEQSLRFHLGCGFNEANRIICFTKKL